MRKYPTGFGIFGTLSEQIRKAVPEGTDDSVVNYLNQEATEFMKRYKDSNKGSMTRVHRMDGEIVFVMDELPYKGGDPIAVERYVIRDGVAELLE